MKGIVVRKSHLGQFSNGKGVFAARDFKKWEIVVKYSLKLISKEEFGDLPSTEKIFTHRQHEKIYLYSIPERYVNHSSNPNTIQDLKLGCDIAKRDIKKGEEITTDATKDDV